MRRAIAFLLVIVFAFVPAAAAWHGLGTNEPDSSWDVSEGRMPLAPDTTIDARDVYFDVFPTAGGPAAFSPANGLNVNPNVGTVGARIAPAGLVQYNAFLGIWKDCNKDGYIGLAEGGVQEYRAEILRADTPCPVGGPFNDGAWVDEILFIGMVDPCQYKDNAYRAQHCAGIPGVNDVPAFLENPRVIFSNSTFVWGDLEAPGAPPQIPCPLPPFARGTTAGPSTLLAVVDCQDGRAIGRALDQLPTAIAGLLATRAPANLFGDPQTGKTGLLQRGAGDDSARVFDCAQPRANAVHDPTAPEGRRGALAVDVPVTDPSNGMLSGNQGIPVAGQKQIFPVDVRTEDANGNVAWLAAVDPAVGDPSGSWWDAVAGAVDAIGPAGDCDPRTPNAAQVAYPGAFVETDRSPLSDLRAASDVTMTFSRGYRGDSHVNDRLGTKNLPDDGGVEYTRNLYGGPLWMADHAVLSQPRAFDRSTLHPDAPLVTTFYAALDPGDVQTHAWGLRRSVTEAGIYGAWSCPDTSPGASPANGWVCDGTQWYKAADGSSTMPRFAEGERIGRIPGDLYHMLDVDCYDQRAADAAPSLAQAC